jgi:hypothetical protein
MRASRWEILGAWLRIWTPPRDVEVPPFPRWAAVALPLAIAGAVAGYVGFIAPSIDDGRQRTAARDQQAHAAAVRRERARLANDQAPRAARAAAAARLYAARRPAQARGALVTAVEASIGRDARDRFAAGSIGVREVRCRELQAEAPRVLLSCFAVTSKTAQASVGQPFVAAGSLRDGRYAWCHQNPPPAEGASLVGVYVALSRACSGR